MLFIKHNFKFIWKIIEWGNGIIFSQIYGPKMEHILPHVLQENSKPPFLFRQLNLADADQLFKLIKSQEVIDLTYFKPHGFDNNSIKRQSRIQSFLMMGVFDRNEMIGYFFLRFFANKKCFVGRLIDKKYRGKGVGIIMNNIMYKTAWRLGFRCLSTISRNNTAVMRSHEANKKMIVLKYLKNDYLLVEFLPEKDNI